MRWRKKLFADNKNDLHFFYPTAGGCLKKETGVLFFCADSDTEALIKPAKLFLRRILAGQTNTLFRFFLFLFSFFHFFLPFFKSLLMKIAPTAIFLLRVISYLKKNVK